MGAQIANTILVGLSVILALYALLLAYWALGGQRP